MPREIAQPRRYAPVELAAGPFPDFCQNPAQSPYGRANPVFVRNITLRFGLKFFHWLPNEQNLARKLRFCLDRLRWIVASDAGSVPRGRRKLWLKFLEPLLELDARLQFLDPVRNPLGPRLPILVGEEDGLP